jgi:colanic acid biosynthesis glycosyl transferase WcaI
MRILIVGINYAPELTGIGKYTTEAAEWLAARGHEVRVICAPPYYPYWRVQKPYSSWAYSHETIAGAGVFRCPVWVPQRPTGFKRIIHLGSFALSSIPACIFQLFWKPDIVIAIEPPLFGAAVALFGAKVMRAKSWLHIQDFELDAAMGLGMIPGWLARGMGIFERWFMGKFDRVSTISNAMMERIRQKGVSSDKVGLFPNWVDCGALRPLERGDSMRAEWGIPNDTKVVLYAGNIGKKQGLELLFPVAQAFLAKRPDVLFIIVGEGAAKVDLERVVFEKGLTNIIFKPLQPIEKLGALLATADVHLVLQLQGAADLVMPSKLTGILAAGGAVLATAEEATELYKVVTQNEVGRVVQPGSSEGVEMGIEAMLDDLTLLQRCQHNARKFAETNLHKESILWDFERELSRVVAPCGSRD